MNLGGDRWQYAILYGYRTSSLKPDWIYGFTEIVLEKWLLDVTPWVATELRKDERETHAHRGRGRVKLRDLLRRLSEESLVSCSVTLLPESNASIANALVHVGTYSSLAWMDFDGHSRCFGEDAGCHAHPIRTSLFLKVEPSVEGHARRDWLGEPICKLIQGVIDIVPVVYGYGGGSRDELPGDVRELTDQEELYGLRKAAFEIGSLTSAIREVNWLNILGDAHIAKLKDCNIDLGKVAAKCGYDTRVLSASKGLHWVVSRSQLSSYSVTQGEDLSSYLVALFPTVKSRGLL